MEHIENGSKAAVVPDTNMNPTNQPVSFYGDNSRSTDAALLAAIATKQPYEYDYAGMIGAGGICDLREEVKDVGSNVRSDIGELKYKVGEVECAVNKSESAVVNKIGEFEGRTMVKLGDVECKIIKENSDQTLYLTNQLSVIREQGIRNEYETKLSREQTIKELGIKIDHKAERAEDKMQALKDFNAEKFCDLEKQLLKCCCEQEVADTVQTGLLNVIANALNVGGLGVATHTHAK